MLLGELADDEEEGTPDNAEEDDAENDNLPGMSVIGSPQD